MHSSILASNAQCCAAASDWLVKNLPAVSILDSPELTGEAQHMARQLVTQICQHKTDQNWNSLNKTNKIFALVSGGETVVSMDSTGTGLGGRSQELALAFACEMRH